MPPDARFPKVFRHVQIRIGRPIDVSRYQDRAGDHLVLRQITDEVMYEIRNLSGQEYVDHYATKQAETLPAETATIHIGVDGDIVAAPARAAERPRARDAGAADEATAEAEPRRRSSADVLRGAPMPG